MLTSYVLPQVLVNQILSEISAEIINPLRAWLIGPNANLFRYSDSTEKANCSIGVYNPAVDTTYAWPHKSTGSIIDQTYAKLYVDQARLMYFSDLVGAGSSITAVNGYNNRIYSDTLSFTKNNAVDRSASLYDRDVQVGDIVHVRGSYNSVSAELWTYVRGFVAEATAAVTDAATADAANADDQSATTTITQTAGDVNELRLAADLTTYNALIDGDLDDTYTVVVTSGSTDGDLTTATLRITSADGYEYSTNVTPADLDTYFTVGNRKLKLKFTSTGVSTGVSSGLALNDLIPGQTWTVRVQPDFTHPNIASSGTYVGTIDNTYVITVTSGGLFADTDTSKRPRVAVSTVYGSDGVSNIAPTVGVDFALGTGGALFHFADVTGLRKGDKFYVDVTAASTGRVSTLILGHSMSSTLLNAADLDLELYIQKDGVSIAEYVSSPTPQFNWTTDATNGMTVNAGIMLYDSTWTDNGVQQPLPLKSGKMYLEYREWLPTVSTSLISATDITQIDLIPGPLHPDNPLKWAFSKALANGNGTGVKATAVADPSSAASWIKSLSIGTGRSDLYSLVPLTTNKTVLDQVVAHVKSMSSASQGKWRKVFVPLVAEAVKPVVTAALSSDSASVLATVADNPDATGTQYTLVTVTSDNAALLDLGVAPGDLFRTNFNTDPVGNTTYDEYVIDHVVNETSVVLAAGPSSGISVAQKCEIHHTRTTDELVAYIGQEAGAYGDRRVCAVWPDLVGSGGITFDGFHMCAALGGLAGGVVPQQNLTNVQIVGFDDVTRTTKLFTEAQLDTLASYGVWIVTQDASGNIFSRDALTTDMTTLETRTEMYTRNLDSISYVLRTRLLPYIGRANVVQSTLDQIQIDIVSGVEYLKTNGYTSRLGGQLIDAHITELRQNILQPDQIVITMSLTLPFPVNTINLTLVA